jgi:hypothetical protein
MTKKAQQYVELEQLSLYIYHAGHRSKMLRR